MDDWEKLTDDQKHGIKDAIDEIDSGKGIAHKKVMGNIRKKFTHVGDAERLTICSIIRRYQPAC